MKGVMFKPIQRTYAKLFAKPVFLKINQWLFQIALRGMGIFSYPDTGETKFFNRYFGFSSQQKKVFLDVGAYIGDYSKQLIQRVPNAQVYAFEPNPESFQKLQTNEGITAYNMALGSTTKTIELRDLKDAKGSYLTSAYEGVFNNIYKSSSFSFKADQTTLDHFCECNNIDTIDLLKIDAEGSEYDVLKGATELLSRGKIKIIQFEFNEMNVESRIFFKDFANLLADYALYRLLPNGLLRLPDRQNDMENYSPLYHEIFTYQNIVAFLKNQ